MVKRAPGFDPGSNDWDDVITAIQNSDPRPRS
jgi:hypothetical protein